MDTKLVLRLMESARSVMPLADVRAASLDHELQGRSGETVRAAVAARLADGSARVLIDGKPFKVALPAEVKPGDVLQLRILPRAPDSTRSLSVPTDHRTEALSSGGQVIARALAQSATEPPHQSKPVVTVPPTRAEDLPDPLARAVERSGVFYESHQARWLDGDFPIERLLDEPQARWNAHPPPQAVKAQGVVELAERTPPKLEQLPPLANGRMQRELTQPPAAQMLELDGPHSNSSLPVASLVLGAEGESLERISNAVVHDTLPILRQQIDALETRQLTWFGDVWPGQPMRWEIGERADSPGDAVAAQEWHSRFTLTLPALGEVAAELTIHGTRIGLRISTRNADSAALMNVHCTELVQAMHDAGLSIARCEVGCDERPV